MSFMMNRVLVFVVLAGFVFCEESNEDTEKPPALSTSPVGGNSTRTSSVTIENKVQKLSVDYKHDHSPTTNTSYVIKSQSPSNTSAEKPLIITTSKEVRLIQNLSTLNDSLTVAPTAISIKPISNSTHRHSYSFSQKKTVNNQKKDASSTTFLPTIKPTASTTTVRPKLPEKRAYESKNNVTKSTTNVPSEKNYAYSYFKMAKPKDISSDVDVVQMEVKEMRNIENRKENNRFQFYIVDDGDSNESEKQSVKPLNSTASSELGKFLGKTRGNHHQQRPILNKDKKGHSKPNQEDWVPKKYNGFSHFQANASKSTTSSPEYTVRPERHHSSNISKTTGAPVVSHKKTNSSNLNLVKNGNADSGNRHVGCLRCAGNNKNVKQQKYPTYPSKKESSTTDSLRAVKLQGPDGDSILEDSSEKLQYRVSKPGKPYLPTNSSSPRIPKSGLKNHKNSQSYLEQTKERRKPFLGLDNAGRYSFHSGESGEYSPSTRYGTKDSKKPDMSDLYNLDELESSGSSMSRSHVMYETKEIHIPYAVTVEKKVSYPIHIKVDRPVPVHIEKPYPVHVEKKVPVPVKVNVPQPYPVEKEVPYPVKIPIEVPRPVEVAKPVPYIVDKPVPIQVIKEVKFPVKVPVDVPIPYKVPVRVEKRVPYFVEKKVPFEVPVAVEKPYLVEIKKPFEVPVEKPHPVTIEKKIPVPVQVVEFVKVPIPVKVPVHGYSDYLQRSSDSKGNQEKDGNIGVIPATSEEETSSEKRQSGESQFQRRTGSNERDSNEKEDEEVFNPYNLPKMISIEFHHPDSKQRPKVTTLSEDASDS